MNRVVREKISGKFSRDLGRCGGQQLGHSGEELASEGTGCTGREQRADGQIATSVIQFVVVCLINDVGDPLDLVLTHCIAVFTCGCRIKRDALARAPV